MTIFSMPSIVLLLAALLATGCIRTGAKGGGPAAGSPPNASGTPPDAGTGAAATGPTFQPGDVMILEVFQEETLSGEFVVSADGSIRHPLLGNVWVKGMLPSVAEGYVERLLRDGILVNPRVTVKLKTNLVNKFVINGQINKPGVYDVPHNERLTLTGAIARAGGFTNIARPSQVRVVRTVNGVEETIPVDVTDLFSGKKPDLVLQPDDKIFVPESPF